MTLRHMFPRLDRSYFQCSGSVYVEGGSNLWGRYTFTEQLTYLLDAVGGHFRVVILFALSPLVICASLLSHISDVLLLSPQLEMEGVATGGVVTKVHNNFACWVNLFKELEGDTVRSVRSAVDSNVTRSELTVTSSRETASPRPTDSTYWGHLHFVPKTLGIFLSEFHVCMLPRRSITKAAP